MKQITLISPSFFFFQKHHHQPTMRGGGPLIQSSWDRLKPLIDRLCINKLSKVLRISFSVLLLGLESCDSFSLSNQRN